MNTARYATAKITAALQPEMTQFTTSPAAPRSHQATVIHTDVASLLTLVF
jgi:hypothetical protein